MDSFVIQTLSDQEIGKVLLAVLVLLISALICGNLAMYLKIPKVAGELFGGIIAGPSVLGAILPGVYEYLFQSSRGMGEQLSVFYWLGLIYMMFSTGYETDLGGMKKDRKIVLALLVGSTVLPMALGYCIADAWFARYYLGAIGNMAAFKIVFAIGVAITSLPVISKIFMDIGINDHRFARIVLTTSTIQDLLLWILLSVATSMVTTSRVGAEPTFSKYKEISLAFFVPVYFAIIGLQVNVTGAFSIGRFLLYFFLAFAAEFLGCVISMRLIRMGWASSIMSFSAS